MKSLSYFCLLFVIFLSAIAQPAIAQPINPVLMSCNGKYSNWKTNILEATFQSGVIRIEKNYIYVAGIPGFSQGMEPIRYQLTAIDSGSISVRHEITKEIIGYLNRLTGEFNFTQKSDSIPNQLVQMAGGFCKISERLF